MTKKMKAVCSVVAKKKGGDKTETRRKISNKKSQR